MPAAVAAAAAAAAARPGSAACPLLDPEEGCQEATAPASSSSSSPSAVAPSAGREAAAGGGGRGAAAADAAGRPCAAASGADAGGVVFTMTGAESPSREELRASPGPPGTRGGGGQGGGQGSSQEAARGRARSSSSFASEVPPSFKAGKRRRSSDFIIVEEPGGAGAAGAGGSGAATPAWRHPSRVDPLLVDGSEDATVAAGVARLLYRLIAEGEQQQRQQQLQQQQQRRLSRREAASAARGGAGGEDDRSRWFDEDRFFEPRVRCRLRIFGREIRCCRRWRKDTSDSIFTLLQSIASTGHLSKELVVIAAIYVERLVRHALVRLSSRNWRPVLVGALLMASKVWEDIHPWNADFADILRRAADLRLWKPGNLYLLESMFLDCLAWKVCIHGEEYARYYFALSESSSRPSTPRVVEGLAEAGLAGVLGGGAAGDAEARPSSWCGPTTSSRGDYPPLSPLRECAAEEASRSGGGGPATGGPPSSGGPTRAPGTGSSARSHGGDSRGEAPLPVVSPRRLAFMSKSCVEAPCWEDSRLAVAPSGALARELAASVAAAQTAAAAGGSAVDDVAVRIGKIWWLDPTNPLVGTFRHAPPASPPSRHIGGGKAGRRRRPSRPDSPDGASAAAAAAAAAAAWPLPAPPPWLAVGAAGGGGGGGAWSGRATATAQG